MPNDVITRTVGNSHLQNSHERLDRIGSTLIHRSDWMLKMFLGSRRVCRISSAKLLSHPDNRLWIFGFPFSAEVKKSKY